MPYFKSSQEWLDQSALLLEASPSTTRITTRYSIKPVKPYTRKSDGVDGTSTVTSDAETKPPRGSLVITTHDTLTGVTLKYRTTKAAEVSRLVYASLGRLGRGMAAMPMDIPEEAMPDAPAGAAESGEGEAKGGASTPSQQTQQQSQQGGGKKKKKGRK